MRNAVDTIRAALALPFFVIGGLILGIDLEALVTARLRELRELRP